MKFWLLPEIRSMSRDGRVRFLPRTRPDFVLALTGYRQGTTLFAMLGVDLIRINQN